MLWVAFEAVLLRVGVVVAADVGVVPLPVGALAAAALCAGGESAASRLIEVKTYLAAIRTDRQRPVTVVSAVSSATAASTAAAAPALLAAPLAASCAALEAADLLSEAAGGYRWALAETLLRQDHFENSLLLQVVTGREPADCPVSICRCDPIEVVADD